MTEREERIAGQPGRQGETGERGPRGRKGPLGGVLYALIALFVSAFLMSGAALYLATREIHRFEQAQAAQRLHDQAAARAAAKAKTEAQIKAAVPICIAFRKLADVRGSHGHSSATYGVHLQQAFRGFYASSGCSKVLRETGHG